MPKTDRAFLTISHNLCTLFFLSHNDILIINNAFIKANEVLFGVIIGDSILRIVRKLYFPWNTIII